MGMIKKIREIAHHRNGICGKPFYAVRFLSTDNQEMLGMVPSRQNTPGQVECYVVDVALLTTVGVGFGLNSWRGDHYADELMASIAEFEDSDGCYEESGWDMMEDVQQEEV